MRALFCRQEGQAHGTHRQLHVDLGPVQEKNAALQHQFTAAGGRDVDGGSGAVHDPSGVRRGREASRSGGGCSQPPVPLVPLAAEPTSPGSAPGAAPVALHRPPAKGPAQEPQHPGGALPGRSHPRTRSSAPGPTAPPRETQQRRPPGTSPRRAPAGPPRPPAPPSAAPPAAGTEGRAAPPLLLPPLRRGTASGGQGELPRRAATCGVGRRGGAAGALPLGPPAPCALAPLAASRGPAARRGEAPSCAACPEAAPAPRWWGRPQQSLCGVCVVATPRHRPRPGRGAERSAAQRSGAERWGAGPPPAGLGASGRVLRGVARRPCCPAAHRGAGRSFAPRSPLHLRPASSSSSPTPVCRFRPSGRSEEGVWEVSGGVKE